MHEMDSNMILEEISMEQSVFSLIDRHIRERPSIQAEDIYKLLYQSCMGLGHLLSDPKEAFGRLVREINECRLDIVDDPLTEDITLQHPLVRVNLRPFFQLGLDPNLLFDAMLLTEKTFSPSRSSLVEAWNIYLHLESAQKFPGIRNKLEIFARWIDQADFPVQHHSQIYRDEYHPSYRIVASNVFQGCFGNSEGFHK
jgi:hypothetical protein